MSADERTGKAKAGEPWGHNICTFNPKAKHCCAHRALLKPNLGHCRALPARCAVVENLQVPLQHHLLLSLPYPTLPSTPPTLQPLSNLQGASVWEPPALGMREPELRCPKHLGAALNFRQRSAPEAMAALSSRLPGDALREVLRCFLPPTVGTICSKKGRF